MSEIISFEEYVAKKNDDLHYVDHNGDIWYPYQYEYALGNRKFGFNLHARNDDEAATILRALSKAKILGRVLHEEVCADSNIIDALIKEPTVTFLEEEPTDDR